jgi:hypothetical protein
VNEEPIVQYRNHLIRDSPDCRWAGVISVTFDLRRKKFASEDHILRQEREWRAITLITIVSCTNIAFLRRQLLLMVDGKDKCRVVARLGIFRAPASLARRSAHTEELRASTGIFVTALARFGYY